MNFMQATSLLVMGLSVTACGGGGGSSSPSTAGSSPSTVTVTPKPKTVVTSTANGASKAAVPALAGQTADIIPMNNNMIHVVYSLLRVQDLQRGNQIADNTKAYIDNSTNLDLAGLDIPLVNIDMPSPTLIELPAFHCYETNNLAVKKEGRELYIDGVISEYDALIKNGAGNNVTASCTNKKLNEYSFKNTVVNEDLIVESIDSVSYEDSTNANTVFLPTYQFSALVYEQRLKSNFGHAWALMQNEHINNAAKELGNHLFVSSLRTIDLDISGLTSEVLIDFDSLDKVQLLNGAIWGMPGQGVADQRWCKIVNLPDNSNSDTLKYQAVIATNCARSTKRWCNTLNPSDIALNAAPPVAWSDSTAAAAQITADAEKIQFVNSGSKYQSLLPNVSSVASYSAITPLFGYGDPVDTNAYGQSNNAGLSSQAGRTASCQAMMNPSHTEMGLGYAHHLILNSNYSLHSFWTQTFN